MPAGIGCDACSYIIRPVHTNWRSNHLLRCAGWLGAGICTQHNTTQHNTTQHNSVPHNSVPHNSVPHNTVQHSYTFGHQACKLLPCHPRLPDAFNSAAVWWGSSSCSKSGLFHAANLCKAAIIPPQHVMTHKQLYVTPLIRTQCNILLVGNAHH